jgi:hypothetical protein
MRARTNFLIDAAAIGVYLVATNPVATGTPLHEWLSIAAALIAFIHLVRHWDWTVHVTQRVLRKLGAASRLNFAVDVALLVAFVTVFMSGLAVSRSALKPLGRIVSETSMWHAVHSQSSTVLLALMGLHLGLHWHWLVSTFRHQIVSPLRNPGAAHQRQAKAVARSRPTTAKRGRGRLHGAANVLAATLITLAIAGAVYVAVGATGGRLLPTWLALPGEPGVALSAAANGSSPVPQGPADVAPAREREAETARGFEGTTAQRIAVRTGHSLVVVAVALALGVAWRGLLRSG